MSATSQIPIPAHTLAESMLSRRFGRETANYFSSSPLNRLSFLRGDHSFLSSALKHPSTRFLLLNNLTPLTRSPAELYYAKYEEIRKMLPSDVFDQSEEDMIKNFDSRKTNPILVFLGLDESRKENGLTHKIYTGAPTFALDITPKGSESQQTAAKDVISELEAKGLSFFQTRVVTTFTPDDAAAYAQARAYVDWNSRNTFCGTCGHPTLSVNGGTKKTCPPTDAALPNPERPACSTRTTLSNLNFPRTDPTIIVAVVSHDGKRLLLGRSKAVPAELVSDPAHEEINLEHDPELADAKWFPVEEVEEALRIGTSDLGAAAGPEYKGGLRLPPATAIAHQLIKSAIAADYFQADSGEKTARI
ncbi:hypothetical protein N7470_006022 [Penicillium chermesinum]|nr:hypothetical protein N7470_006022 [Penicillium chermesinum]